MPFNEGILKFKKCPACNTRRAIECFNRSGPGMRRSQCRECEKAARTTRDADGMASSTRHNIRRRYKILQHYSGKETPACECCGEMIYEFLSIDHVDGGGSKHRAEIGSARIYAWIWKNGLPAGFRVLCHNCNQAIGAYGFCPHKHPQRSLTAPPPLVRLKRQAAVDQQLIEAAGRLKTQLIPVTAQALASATGYTLTSVERRLARLRTNGMWPFPRHKRNGDKF